MGFSEPGIVDRAFANYYRYKKKKNLFSIQEKKKPPLQFISRWLAS